MALPELTALLPHRGTALWLTAITEHDQQSITGECDRDCLAELTQQHSAYFFEAAAQLCAAHGALYAKHNSPTEAYIGKLSKLKVYQQATSTDGPLQVKATQQSANELSAAYLFTVTQQQQVLLDGTLLLVLNHA